MTTIINKEWPTDLPPRPTIGIRAVQRAARKIAQRVLPSRSEELYNEIVACYDHMFANTGYQLAEALNDHFGPFNDKQLIALESLFEEVTKEGLVEQKEWINDLGHLFLIYPIGTRVEIPRGGQRVPYVGRIIGNTQDTTSAPAHYRVQIENAGHTLDMYVAYENVNRIA